MASKALHAAITRLAALYGYGALQADTDPAAFLHRVADDVENMREECRRLRGVNLEKPDAE